jgi:hypothetical protein
VPQAGFELKKEGSMDFSENSCKAEYCQRLNIQSNCEAKNIHDSLNSEKTVFNDLPKNVKFVKNNTRTTKMNISDIKK